MKMKMKLFCGVIFFLCLYSSSISATSTQFSFCDETAEYGVKVQGLDIDPYPISKNKVTSFRIVASTEKPISDGKLEISVTYFGFHVHGEEHELCKETTCPVPIGDFVLSHSQALPAIAPPGNYNLRLKLVDSSKTDLTEGASFDFTLGFFSKEGASLTDT